MQKSVFFLFIIVFFGACATEPKEVLPTANDLLGHWQVVAGKRDSMATTMLNDKTFDFTANEISTLLPMNASDSVSKSPFTFDGDSLVCPAYTANFKVVSLRKDTMVLFTRRWQPAVTFVFAI
jgi:hypothetical protein